MRLRATTLMLILGTLVASIPGQAEPALGKTSDGFLKAGFEVLADYPFKAPVYDPAENPSATPPTGEEQIPVQVKALDGSRIEVAGYMIPVLLKDGLVTEFLLVKDAAMCCFGTVPNMNEWIVVKMDKGVRPVMDVALKLYGTLSVGTRFENGYATGIYFLQGSRVEVGSS